MSVSRSLWNEEAFPLLLPALCSRRAVGDLGGVGLARVCASPSSFSSGLSALGTDPSRAKAWFSELFRYSAFDA